MKRIKRISKSITGLLMAGAMMLGMFPSAGLADENGSDSGVNADSGVTATAGTPRVIVSMGDSFSAGEGIQPFYGSRTSTGDDLADWLARRSVDSWPGQLCLPEVGEMRNYKGGNDENAKWYFTAASGAVIWNMEHTYKRKYLEIESATDFHAEFVDLDPQIEVFDPLQYEGIVPDYVTLTLGGNDLGFVPIIIQALVAPSYIAPGFVYSALEDAMVKLNKYTKDKDGNEELCVRGKLEEAYAEIYNRASIDDKSPWILVAGYPHLLNDGSDKFGNSVGDLVTNIYIYDQIEAALINNRIDYFNEAIKDIVTKMHDEHGMQIKYVDVAKEFKGHEAYTKDPWINGVVIPTDRESLDPRPIVINEEGDILNVNGKSIHPTATGAYMGYRKCVQEAIDEIEGRRVTRLLINAYDADTLEPIGGKDVTISFANPDVTCTWSTQISDADGVAKFYVSRGYKPDNANSDLTIHIDGYKDYLVEDYLFNIKTEDLQSIPVILEKDTGGTSTRKKITFGEYAGEDIDWIVLDETADSMFVISEKVIEDKRYNEFVYELTWENSELRKWLNDDFYNSAFDSNEKKRIIKTHLQNPDNPEAFVSGGNDTDDYVFLLSFEELDKYFDGEEDRRAEPTEHTVESYYNPPEGWEVTPLRNEYFSWWLRTPGAQNWRDSSAEFTYVYSMGDLELYGGAPVELHCGVRPAMWISKE